MAIREFDGATDSLTLSAGALGSITSGAYSVIVVAKPTTIDAIEGYVDFLNGGSLKGGLFQANNDRLAIFSDVDDSRAAADVTAGAWQILAVTKAAGASNPRFHRKELGAGVWTHNSSATPVDNNATSTTSVKLANGRDTRYAVASVFTGALSDLQVESVQTTPATATLNDLGALGLWDLNQASTGTAVVDLTAGHADQSALTGTTVIVGDDPPGWTFGVATVTPGPPLRVVRSNIRFGF